MVIYYDKGRRGIDAILFRIYLFILFWKRELGKLWLYFIFFNFDLGNIEA